MKPAGALLCVVLSGLSGFGAARLRVEATTDDVGTLAPRTSAPSVSSRSPIRSERPAREPGAPAPAQVEILEHSRPGSADALALFRKHVQSRFEAYGGSITYHTEWHLRRMLEEDLAGSLAFLDGIADKKVRTEDTHLMLYGPSHGDVPELLRWMERQADPEYRREVLSVLINAWTADDQVAALGAIEALPEGTSRSELYAQMLKGLPVRRQMATLPKIPEADRESFFVAHAKKLSTTVPEEALGSIVDLSPSEGRELALTDLLRNWASKDPFRAIATIEAHNDPQLQAQSFRDVAFGWSGVDSYRASKWVDGLPPGPARDAASSGLAEELTAAQPNMAFDWAESIRDPDLRVQSLRQVLEEWRGADPQAAAAAVTGSQLNEEDRSALDPQPKPTNP